MIKLVHVATTSSKVFYAIKTLNNYGFNLAIAYFTMPPLMKLFLEAVSSHASSTIFQVLEQCIIQYLATISNKHLN